MALGSSGAIGNCPPGAKRHTLRSAQLANLGPTRRARANSTTRLTSPLRGERVYGPGNENPDLNKRTGTHRVHASRSRPFFCLLRRRNDPFWPPQRPFGRAPAEPGARVNRTFFLKVQPWLDDGRWALVRRLQAGTRPGRGGARCCYPDVLPNAGWRSSQTCLQHGLSREKVKMWRPIAAGMERRRFPSRNPGAPSSTSSRRSSCRAYSGQCASSLRQRKACALQDAMNGA